MIWLIASCALPQQSRGDEAGIPDWVGDASIVTATRGL